MHIHAVGLLIPCIVQYIHLLLFFNIAVNLWSNGMNVINLHKCDLSVKELCCPASNLLCKDVVLCILCTMLISFSNVSNVVLLFIPLTVLCKGLFHL